MGISAILRNIQVILTHDISSVRCRRRQIIEAKRDHSKNADDTFFHKRWLQPVRRDDRRLHHRQSVAVALGDRAVFWPLRNELAAVSNLPPPPPPPPHFICCSLCCDSNSNRPTKRSGAQTRRTVCIRTSRQRIAILPKVSIISRANISHQWLRETHAFSSKRLPGARNTQSFKLSFELNPGERGGMEF